MLKINVKYINLAIVLILMMGMVGLNVVGDVHVIFNLLFLISSIMSLRALKKSFS